MSLQLQHYNKSYAYTEKVVTFLPNHPSIILRSSFVHPSFILRSSFVHPSIGDMRMIIGLAQDGRRKIDLFFVDHRLALIMSHWLGLLMIDC